MPAYRKASIRELTQAAANLDGRFVQGILHRDPESGVWMVGQTTLSEWVARNDGEEVTMIVLSMDEGRPLEKRTCRTCGRDYIGYECPYCRETRNRLRGR
ncbi:MAG: hypothetical protein ACP5HG_05860 [Anaerolineae bacterium]